MKKNVIAKNPSNTWVFISWLWSSTCLYHVTFKYYNILFLVAKYLDTSKPPFNLKIAYPRLNLFRYEWIWVKDNSTGFLQARKMPLKLTENILVFYKKLPTYNPQGVVDLEKPVVISKSSDSRNYGLKEKMYIKTQKNFPKNLLKFARDKERFHPTQKPVALLEYLVQTYTNENDVVLDNCMGSGSTGVACMNTNRNFIGIELDQNYFETATHRINEAKKKNVSLNES